MHANPRQTGRPDSGLSLQHEFRGALEDNGGSDDETAQNRRKQRAPAQVFSERHSIAIVEGRGFCWHHDLHVFLLLRRLAGNSAQQLVKFDAGRQHDTAQVIDRQMGIGYTAGEYVDRRIVVLRPGVQADMRFHQ